MAQKKNKVGRPKQAYFTSAYGFHLLKKGESVEYKQSRYKVSPLLSYYNRKYSGWKLTVKKLTDETCLVTCVNRPK